MKLAKLKNDWINSWKIFHLPSPKLQSTVKSVEKEDTIVKIWKKGRFQKLLPPAWQTQAK